MMYRRLGSRGHSGIVAVKLDDGASCTMGRFRALNSKGLSTVKLGLCRAAAAMTLIFASTTLVAPVGAQTRGPDVQGIEAIVNDAVISVYDVDQRLNLILASVNAQITPEQRRGLRQQALQNLIDEKLQLQEAAEYDLVISNEEADETIAMIGQQYNMNPPQFAAHLARTGASVEALRQQIKAELAWSRLVRGRFRQQIEVSDEEVQTVMKRMTETTGQNEYQVSEITLLVDTPEQEAEVRQRAEQIIAQLRQGVPFNIMARQFSEAPTAAVGGDLGWVPQGQLPTEVETALESLPQRSVSEPIRTANGFSIIQLRDRRKILTPDASDEQLTLHQLLFDRQAGETVDAATARLRQTLSGLKTCEDIPSGNSPFGAKASNRVGTLQFGELPPPAQTALANVAAGQTSAPLESEEGWRVLVVCDRKMPETKMPTAEAVSEQLSQQKLALMARRYLRDLRRDGIIDLR